MCVDISLHSSIQLTLEAFPGIKDMSTAQLSPELLEDVPAFVFPPYNVISKAGPDTVLSTMEWGVVPTWIKDPKEQKERRLSMVNIQSERILEDKKSTWYRIRKNRILIPVDGIFEHREIKGWKKKVPYYIYNPDGKPFFIPGLFQESTIVDEDAVVHTVSSFGLITRTANPVMMAIHNAGKNKHRMPLFISFQMAQAWVSESLQDNEMREIIDFQAPDQDLAHHTVYSLRGGTQRPDGKHKYDPWDWPGLPELGNDTPVDPQKSLF